MGMGMETSTGTIRGGDEVSEGGGRKMGKHEGKSTIVIIN